ncbi:MAG: hypothetical protein EXS37_06375 [Opitutus sp.]|nr:hypothetical protein [Opitutus sp.]
MECGAAPAREEGMPAITEGASKIYHDITLLMDGFTTLEHTIKTATLYKDVRALIERTTTFYTPTLIVGVNGSAEEYFYQRSDVFRDAKLLRFTPYAQVAAYARHRMMRPEEDYYFKSLGASAAKIMQEGGNVTLGAHGNRQGLGAHWEMWAMAMGGMSPHDVLRAATNISASALGLDEDLGSLDVGKVADLVVLDRNPLDDIRNTNTVRYVMKNGVLWDGDTMDEVWPQPKKFEGFHWQRLR